MGVAMSNQSQRAQPHSRTAAQIARVGVLAVRLCAGAAVPAVLEAQVGHDPQHSPFQDVTTHQTFTTLVSQFLGNRAHAGVGAQGGLSVGGRFSTALSGPLELWATFAMIN